MCGIAIHAGSIGPAAGQARLWEEPGPCGRECLTGIVDSYLEALVAHDPAAAPLAGEAAFVENAERLDGLPEVARAFRKNRTSHALVANHGRKRP